MLHDMTESFLGAESDKERYNCLPTSGIFLHVAKMLPACLAGRKCNSSKNIVCSDGLRFVPVSNPSCGILILPLDVFVLEPCDLNVLWRDCWGITEFIDSFRKARCSTVMKGHIS